MPDRSRPPYRADHIGSLKRPASLLKAREDFQAGKITQEELRRFEDEAIKGAIALQKRYGIKGITDGEYRRQIFYAGLFENIEGMEIVHDIPASALRSFIPSSVVSTGQKVHTSSLVAAKLRRTKPLYVPEFNALKALVPEEDVRNLKITTCSPVWYDSRYGKAWIKEGSNAYQSRAELFEDLTAIYREEIADLYAAGCRNIQIDEPTFTYFCHAPTIKGFKEIEGIDSLDLLEEYIDIFNQCLRDKPEDMTIGVHLCRGNFRGKHFAEGSYAPIAEKLFQKMNVDCFYLEYDTERAGGFEPLIHLPKNKVAVLGLVTTKTPKLESPELIVSRIEEAVKIIKDAHPDRTREEILDQLCLSPQCGFASEVQGNPITEEDMEKKLELISNVSRKVWGY